MTEEPGGAAAESPDPEPGDPAAPADAGELDPSAAEEEPSLRDTVLGCLVLLGLLGLLYLAASHAPTSWLCAGASAVPVALVVLFVASHTIERGVIAVMLLGLAWMLHGAGPASDAQLEPLRQIAVAALAWGAGGALVLALLAGG